MVCLRAIVLQTLRPAYSPWVESMIEQQPPLILTLQLDQASFERLDGLRQTYFPPERNFIPAHITLFHALPGHEEGSISADLARICAEVTPFGVAFPSLHMLGRGVALVVEAPALRQLRQQLAARWQSWLSPQDRQGYRPHVTIQNKVSPEQARALHAQLSPQWEPFAAQGLGLFLWRYLGGPWEQIKVFAFTREASEL
jgi:2'-5' RNA ligase